MVLTEFPGDWGVVGNFPYHALVLIVLIRF